MQQLLQGLTTGNQSQDQALREAFERGYQRGWQDEARLQRPDRGRSDRPGRRGTDDRDDGGYRDDQEPDRPVGRQDGPYRR